ncbi:hypothetical protein TRIATDRAFT_255422 [Trichoderma atroviride IMI 206040]|uniref:Uncharacterized protein n=1 Tax=Hypocrea atroviridis (strain ATCC 20476 / IMI 206040) TaxID=452589 RepID=G9NLH2_HYPAI|nr:uncharacterized protein TRIATDRAFT_255422 [Trichoderma atroviride IMI 206040]EHK48736.1 hypothetical protein TRIATDRAFT_255422 [Trichoderma atroviride IMI 206040]
MSAWRAVLSRIRLGTVELVAEKMLDRKEVDPAVIPGGHDGPSGWKSLDSLGLRLFMCNDYPITTLQALSFLLRAANTNSRCRSRAVSCSLGFADPCPEEGPIDLGAGFGRSENEAVLASCSRIEQQWSDKPHLAEQTGDKTGFCRCA